MNPWRYFLSSPKQKAPCSLGNTGIDLQQKLQKELGVAKAISNLTKGAGGVRLYISTQGLFAFPPHKDCLHFSLEGPSLEPGNQTYQLLCYEKQVITLV